MTSIDGPSYTSVKLFACTSPRNEPSNSAPPEPTVSAVEGICRTISAECTTNSEQEAGKMDKLKQRLQQLREEAAMGGGHQHIRVMRRASAVCDGLKKMQDSCSGQIDKIVEKQKNFFRSLPEDELETFIENKYNECNKKKNGRMTRKEFAYAMAIMGKEFTEAEVQKYFMEIDANNDKAVCPAEFNAWFRNFISAPPKPPTPDPKDRITLPSVGSKGLSKDPLCILEGPAPKTVWSPKDPVTDPSIPNDALGLPSASPAATAAAPPPSRSRGRRRGGSLSKDSPGRGVGKENPAAELEKRKQLFALYGSLRPRTSSKPADSGDNSNSDSSSMRPSTSLSVARARTASPASKRPFAGKGRNAPRRLDSLENGPALPSAARAQEFEAQAQLEKRKKLSWTYGRLPGWSARGRGRDGPGSASPLTPLTPLSAGTSRAASDAELAWGSDSAASTPTDVTKGSATHWGVALRNTFKLKQDAVRDEVPEQREQDEDKKKPALGGPLFRLRKAVKTLLAHGSSGVTKPDAEARKPEEARALESDSNSHTPDVVTTETVPSVIEAVTNATEEAQGTGIGSGSSAGGAASVSSLLGDWGRLRRERGQEQAKLAA